METEKKLVIVRHGKSDWSREDRSDVDRPLKDRGVRDAYEMSQRLLQQNIQPELVASSPANRALHTAVIFCREMEIPLKNLLVDESFYISYEEKVFETLQQFDNKVNSLMIFGHNPTFTSLANLFVSDEIENIPTCGIVILNFKIKDWQEIAGKTLESYVFDYPKKSG